MTGHTCPGALCCQSLINNLNNGFTEGRLSPPICCLLLDFPSLSLSDDYLLWRHNHAVSKNNTTETTWHGIIYAESKDGANMEAGSVRQCQGFFHLPPVAPCLSSSNPWQGPGSLTRANHACHNRHVWRSPCTEPMLGLTGTPVKKVAWEQLKNGTHYTEHVIIKELL